MSMKKLKKKLKLMRVEQIESIKVQTSSTKLLNFLVNDMLDLSQMNSGKFRKNVLKFNIFEAITEIVNI